MRLKRLLISLLLILTMTTQTFAAAIPAIKLEFPDIKDHWAEKYIHEFTEKGIIKGYPDGTFKPDRNISRAEFSSLLFHLLKLEKPKDEKVIMEEFEDFWAEAYLESLADKEIIDVTEYPEGYDVNGPITRIEIAKMIIRSLGKGQIANNIKSSPGFKDDNSIKESDLGYVYLAKHYDIIAGYEDGKFRPENQATRAETVKMLVARDSAVKKIEAENKPSSSFPKAVIDFKLPEYTHTDKEVTFDWTSRNTRRLIWALEKSDNQNQMVPVELSQYASFQTEGTTGKIQFQDKGLYSLVANARNAKNQQSLYAQSIQVYPVMDVQFGLLETAYTDTEVAVNVSTIEVGDAEIQWSIEKNGETTPLDECIEGDLDNNGGVIRFLERGDYTLIASVTDEVGRTFEHRDSIKIYNLISTEFDLPETAYTDDFIEVTVNESGLEYLDIEWVLEKEGKKVELNDFIEGSLTNEGGKIRFKEKGEYLLTAKVTDETGRVFTKEDFIKIYPLIEAAFELPESTHTDQAVEIKTSLKELGDLNIEWSLIKDNKPVQMTEFMDGALDNRGGTIKFKEKGNYTLKATATDELGRSFEFTDSIMVYPVVEVSFDMPSATHVDEGFNLVVTHKELNQLNIEWILEKDGEKVSLSDYIAGNLSNDGGSITFPIKGEYKLIANVIDELGRVFSYSDQILVYPLVEIGFDLPDNAHTDDIVSVDLKEKELGDLNVQWFLFKEGQEVAIEEYIDGTLDNRGGEVKFTEKGEYLLKATVKDDLERAFEYSDSIIIYPLVEVGFNLPTNAHTDEQVEVQVTTRKLGNLKIEWVLEKNGQLVNLKDYVDGEISNDGGYIRFKDKGEYVLTAKITDALGRVFKHSSSIKIYPVMTIFFDLPEYAHTDTSIEVNVLAEELENAKITWNLEKDGKPVQLSEFVDGNLTNEGGTIRLLQKGEYKLLASASNDLGRLFSFDDTIKAYPLPNFEMTLPTSAHIGVQVPVSIVSNDTENMDLQWKLKKDGAYVKLGSYVTGEIVDGGEISFNSVGVYEIEATLTDPTGRSFVKTASIVIQNRNPEKPTISANVTRQISNGKFLVTLNINSSDPDGDTITYEYEGKAQDNYYLPGTHTVKVRAKDQYGAYSNWSSVQFEVINNAPLTPVIIRMPDTNSVSPGTLVKITASSSDPDGDPFTYVWEGRPAENAKYPLGKSVVKVKAVDAAGAESPWAAIVFFVADAENGGGMTLTGPSSTIIENGIDGATITEYTFNVPAVRGHSGRDYGRVRGFNVQTNKWEQIDYRSTRNGVYMTKTLPAGKYSKLEFYYYTNHSCMYNKSNITYTVKYHFE